MAKESHQRIPVAISEPPLGKIDDEYLRKAMSDIRATQLARKGAADLTAKLITLFGSIITAAAIGMFVWMWEANASNAQQDSAIERVNERHAEHGHRENERGQRETVRRVDGLERGQKNISRRLDRQDVRLQEILQAVQRGNRRRRWGN